MNILVIEDEQLAGEKLQSYIHKYISDAVHIVWLRSVSEVRSFLKTDKKIDLIFSDIELLDGNVFAVYESMKIKCPIIFCTAYDQFILKAFKTNGIAYLLKPYNEEQFREAWKKYQLLFNKEDDGELSEQLINELKLIVKSKGSDFKSRFTIKKSNGIFLLAVSEIIYFQSQGDFILAVDQKRNKHVINQSLSKVLSSLDPSQFFQINRSEIVNVEYIEKFEIHFKNKLVISLRGVDEVLYTSSSRTPEFRNWIE